MICQTCRHALLRTARSSLRPAALQQTLRPITAYRPLPSNLAARRSLTTTSRLHRASPAPEESTSMSPAETSIADLLRSKLDGPVTHVLVQDISGGCGSMYAIEVTAEDFRGKTMLKQQRMVNAALGEVIKGWHGVQIRTMVPEA